MSGASEIKTRIAGITFALEGLTKDWVWTDRDSFEALARDHAPDVVVRVHVASADERIPVGNLVRTVDGLRNVYVDDKSWAFEFVPYKREMYPQRPPHQMLVFDRRFTSGDLWVSVDTGLEQPSFSFGLFLSELLSGMLSFYGGMMLHASGIRDDGRGIVFVGPSGAGKSTMAALWQGYAGARVLNDDRIILRRKDGLWWAYPVPGVGEPRSGSQEGVAVAVAFLVSHGDENAAERMNQAGAASSLLPHISLPSYDAVAVDAVLHLLDQLVNEVPICRLGFLPEQTAVSLVRDVVRQRDAFQFVH